MNWVIDKKAERGFGFIRPEEGQNIFFHGSDCVNWYETFDDLNEGDYVTFDIGEGKDGKPKAVNVDKA